MRGEWVWVEIFSTRNIGVGAIIHMDAFTIPYLLNVEAIYRYPLQRTGFAPYGFGGIGRQWDHAAQWLGHIGVGIGSTMAAEIGSIF